MGHEEKTAPVNGGAPDAGEMLGTCQACGFRMKLAETVERDGKRSHLVAIHNGKPGRGVRPCGPVLQAWIYWLAYTVRFEGAPEFTEAGAVSFDAPISNPGQVANATQQLVKHEAAKLKAVDRSSGAQLIGAPEPKVAVIGWTLLRAF